MLNGPADWLRQKLGLLFLVVNGSCCWWQRFGTPQLAAFFCVSWVAADFIICILRFFESGGSQRISALVDA